MATAARSAVLLLSLVVPRCICARSHPPQQPRTFAAGGLLEFVFPFAIGSFTGSHLKLNIEASQPSAGVEILHREVRLVAGGTIGPKTVPSPELLAHGPLTIYSTPLDGEMRRRKMQDATPQNSDALGPRLQGAICDGKPGMRCTMFGAPLVYGAIGDGVTKRTFLYLQDIGSVGPLLDAAQSLPNPLLTSNQWSRPFGFGWELPAPALHLVLRSNLTVSDSWLITTSEVAVNAGERASLFLRLLEPLLARMTPPSRAVKDWDAVVGRQSDWTLHDAYKNLVPANASTGTWPLNPPDRLFAYIPTYVNDGGDCSAKGTQGTAQCSAQIFSYLEQLEPGLRYLNDSRSRGIALPTPSVKALISGLLGKQAKEGALEIWSVDSLLGPAGSTHQWQTLCIWGGPCSAAGGADSWQVMVQMLRVAGAEQLLGPYIDGRTPIFQRTLNFVIELAHNMDYRYFAYLSLFYLH